MTPLDLWVLAAAAVLMVGCVCLTAYEAIKRVLEYLANRTRAQDVEDLAEEVTKLRGRIAGLEEQARTGRLATLGRRSS